MRGMLNNSLFKIFLFRGYLGSLAMYDGDVGTGPRCHYTMHLPSYIAHQDNTRIHFLRYVPNSQGKKTTYGREKAEKGMKTATNPQGRRGRKGSKEYTECEQRKNLSTRKPCRCKGNNQANGGGRIHIVRVTVAAWSVAVAGDAVVPVGYELIKGSVTLRLRYNYFVGNQHTSGHGSAGAGDLRGYVRDRRLGRRGCDRGRYQAQRQAPLASCSPPATWARTSPGPRVSGLRASAS